MDVFFRKVVELHELINTNASINETLKWVFDEFRNYIPCDRIGIALLDNYGGIYSKAVCSEYQPVLPVGYSTVLTRTSLHSVIKKMECRIINNYKAYCKKHSKSVSIKMILQEGLMSSLACPLVLNNQGMGAIIFSSKQLGCYSENHVPMAKLIANCMAISLEKNLLMNNRLLSSIAQFARLVESKENASGFHIERIQNYSRIIAETLAGKKKYIKIIDRQFIEDIYTFSPLHDIGKIGIADGILLKPGKLTAEEFEIIKQHTVIGAELLRKATDSLSQNGMTYFDMAIQIAESHHEKYDGSGYPFGLAGDDIPLSARIVAVADVFDALTSKRVYRSAYDIEASMQIIDNESCISYDPDIVDALNENIEQIVKTYKRYQENIDLDRR